MNTLLWQHAAWELMTFTVLHGTMKNDAMHVSPYFQQNLTVLCWACWLPPVLRDVPLTDVTQQGEFYTMFSLKWCMLDLCFLLLLEGWVVGWWSWEGEWALVLEMLLKISHTNTPLNYFFSSNLPLFGRFFLRTFFLIVINISPSVGDLLDLACRQQAASD